MKAVRVSNDFFVQLFFYLIPIRFYFSLDDVKMSEKDKTGNLTLREMQGCGLRVAVGIAYYE